MDPERKLSSAGCLVNLAKLQEMPHFQKCQTLEAAQMTELKNVPLTIAPNGRLSIPIKQRKALGLERGGVVVSTVEDGALRIRPIRAVLAELQAKVSGLLAATDRRPGTLLSDELIADRRAEAARQEQEYLQTLKLRHVGDP